MLEAISYFSGMYYGTSDTGFGLPYMRKGGAEFIERIANYQKFALDSSIPIDITYFIGF